MLSAKPDGAAAAAVEAGVDGVADTAAVSDTYA